jgi:large subunit ribosomal protein L25
MATQKLLKIEGQTRSSLGSRTTAKMRGQGRMPAVIYGHKQDPAHISFDQKEVTHLLHQHTHLIEVVVDSKTEPCLVKDVQWDHLGSNILHIDLARVDLTEQVTVEVDLVLAGDPVGLKESGSFLQHGNDQLEVSCLASQIPDQIKIDISGLGVGDQITVADLKLPPGVTATSDDETVIASIQVVGEEAEPVEGDAAAIVPEVIGKKEAEEKGDG